MKQYDKIKSSTTPLLAVLIDPDNAEKEYLNKIFKYCNNGFVDFLFVGGSTTYDSVDLLIEEIKQKTKVPVILFPGNHLQISAKADAILLLSLISGRNPEFLIGNHVLAAQSIKKAAIETIPCGYILIDSGKMTSVEYISNTKPIPADKPEITCSTALAGELLGLKCIYLESGSGAKNYLDIEIIKKVKATIDIPIIVGGGINTKEGLIKTAQAGANVIVIGTAFEQTPELIPSFYTSLK